MAQITGGGNSLRLYRVNTNTAASGVIYLATYHEFDQTISTTLSKTETGFTLSLDQIKSDASILTTFLEEAISATAAVGESVVYEDGISLSASSNNQTYLAVVIGGTVSDSTDRLCWAGLMNADAAATGSVQFTASTYVRPSISFNTIAAASAITLSTTIFNSTLVSQIALTVIPYSRKTGKYLYMKTQA